jgi:hypothetical protein
MMKRLIPLLAIALIGALSVLTNTVGATPDRQDKSLKTEIEIIITAGDRPVANIRCDLSSSSDPDRPSTIIQVAHKDQGSEAYSAAFSRFKITPSLEGELVRIEVAEVVKEIGGYEVESTKTKENLRVIGSYLIPIGKSVSIEETLASCGVPLQIKVVSLNEGLAAH